MTASQTINIRVNGQKEIIPSGQTLQQFIDHRFGKFPNVVAELNGQIIPHDHWGITLLQNQDRLELVHFVGGG
ncbi:MAG: sulfur carrier protein ThiS [Syntrophobacterales bacterium]|jgi:sulfur carrier protein|nr:sulfur carrier protein ThiS [Syntrophobacterales bacterium]